MRKIILLITLSVFVLCGCFRENKSDLYKSILSKDKLVVGISFDSKPFGFKDSDGKIKGLEADLAREIADRILGDENKVEFKNVTSQERVKAATSGDVDMVISTMTITPERKKSVEFSAPYFVAGQAICVRKDSKIDSVYDLINKRVIVILGTTGEKNIKKIVPNAFIQAYVNNSDAINAFKSGSSDAITTDDSLLQGLVMDNINYFLLPDRLTKETYGIAFKKTFSTGKFKKSLNGVLNEIKEDGTLERIKNSWITN